MKMSSSFICANNDVADFNKIINAPLFRKTFVVESIPQKAEITICGLGFYELYINGHNITKGPLSPYISNVNHICYYDCYDIKNYLTKGENVIGIILGNGFRNSYGGFVWDFDKADCRGPVTLALNCELDDYSFESDKSFKTHPSPIIYNDIRMGYKYDARLEIDNWNLPGFDDSQWDNAIMCQNPPKGEGKLCSAPPIAVKNELFPVDVKYYDEMPFCHVEATENSRPLADTVRKNIYLFDFGKNMTGVTKLHIKNSYAGQKIVIRHGELLLNGEFSVSNLIFSSADYEKTLKQAEHIQQDVYICKGGDETFVPKFKYDGFRYAYVEGLLPSQIEKDTLTYLVEYSDVTERAGFKSSDDTLNSLFKMTRDSSLSNMVHIPTDCPHREKNGWTADVSVSAEHFLLNIDCVDFLSEWLYNVFKAQKSIGEIPAIIPTGEWGYGRQNAGPVWDSVCVTLPWAIYKYTGDKSIIIDNANLIMRYFEYIKTRRNDKGLYSHGLGDWAEPLRRYREGYATAAPTEVTSSIAVYEMLTKAEFLFNEAGLTNYAEKVKSFAKCLKSDIRTHLIDLNNFIVNGDCQTSQAYAIATGIFEKDELKSAKDVLLKMIKHDKMLICGIVGRRYIFDILTDMGEVDLAYNLIVSRNIASYGGWVDKGYTTLCESFTPPGIKLDSRNHHFHGDISRYMIEKIAGIQINPGCTDVTSFAITPDFPKDLDFAEAYFDTKFGKISSSWEREGDTVLLNVTVPKNYKGRLSLPKNYMLCSDNAALSEIILNKVVLNEGNYTFTIIKNK